MMVCPKCQISIGCKEVSVQCATCYTLYCNTYYDLLKIDKDSLEYLKTDVWWPKIQLRRVNQPSENWTTR